MKRFSTRTSGRSLFLCLVAFAFIALARGEARADMVTFRVTGCFGVGVCPQAAVAGTTGSGSALLVFSGQPPTTVNTGTPSGFTSADLGTFSIGGVGTFPATQFTLVVTQTLPSAGTGSVTGTLSGTLIVNGSDARLVFDQTNFVIGNVNYQLVNLTNGNTLKLDPNATGGITRLTADISTNPVPEPMTMILFGTGLASVAAKVRRRKRAGASE